MLIGEFCLILLGSNETNHVYHLKSSPPNTTAHFGGRRQFPLPAYCHNRPVYSIGGFISLEVLGSWAIEVDLKQYDICCLGCMYAPRVSQKTERLENAGLSVKRPLFGLFISYCHAYQCESCNKTKVYATNDTTHSNKKISTIKNARSNVKMENIIWLSILSKECLIRGPDQYP